MKKMLLLFVLSTGLTMSAQNRVNKVNDVFVSQSEKLTVSVGWEQNDETGTWIENKNVIHNKLCPSYWTARVEQNFDWLQVNTIKKQGIKYYVFLYERQSGRYKYPNIRKNWENQYNTHFFVLTAPEYESLKSSIELKSGTNIKVSSKIKGHITDRFHSLGGEDLYNETNLLAKITKAIENPSYSESSMIFNSQITDGVELLRFRLPERSSLGERKMNTQYFENKYEDFKALLIE